MKENKSTENLVQEQEAMELKESYNKPILKEHGNVEEVTLQGFFGSFSPPPPGTGA